MARFWPWKGQPQAWVPTIIPTPTIAFLEKNVDDVDRTTYTFTARPIGTPGNSRAIGIVLVNSDGTPRTVSSVTVDGVSLTKAIGLTSSFSRIEIWVGFVNTANASGNIVVTYTGSTHHCIYFLYEMHYLASIVAAATSSSTTNNAVITAAVSAGGIAIGGAMSEVDPTTFSWAGTGVVDDGDGDSGADATQTLSGAHAKYAAAGTASMQPNAASASQFGSVIATFL